MPKAEFLMPTMTRQPFRDWLRSVGILPERDEDFDHLTCCNEDKSVCGIDFDDTWEEHAEDCGHKTCQVCTSLSDLPCGEPDCPNENGKEAG